MFIGSRLSSFAEGETTQDPIRFWLNIGSLGLALAASTFTGFWIYRLTLEQMRKVESSDQLEEALAAERLLEGYVDGEDGEMDDGDIEAQELVRAGPTERADVIRRTSGSSGEM